MDISDECFLEFESRNMLIRCHSCGSVVYGADTEELRKWKTKVIRDEGFIFRSESVRLFCGKCSKAQKR